MCQRDRIWLSNDAGAWDMNHEKVVGARGTGPGGREGGDGVSRRGGGGKRRKERRWSSG